MGRTPRFPEGALIASETQGGSRNFSSLTITIRPDVWPLLAYSQGQLPSTLATGGQPVTSSHLAPTQLHLVAGLWAGCVQRQGYTSQPQLHGQQEVGESHHCHPFYTLLYTLKEVITAQQMS